MQQKIKNIINFLNDLEALKSELRHSWMSSIRQESVAEHCWRCAIIALVLAPEFPKLNIVKVIKMCLIHDFGEVYCGDSWAFLDQPKDKHQQEEAGVKKLVKPLLLALQKEIIELWREFEDEKTDEAKLAKSIDKLEALIQHNEADISTWLPKEYEFNLTGSHHFMQWNEFIKEFKKAVDDQTKAKIAKSKNKYSDKK